MAKMRDARKKRTREHVIADLSLVHPELTPMAKRARNTFSSLSRTLQSLGFTLIRHDDHIFFADASGRPMILLPAYKGAQTVRPIHLLMVEHKLKDMGLLERGELAPMMLAKPELPSKR